MLPVRPSANEALQTGYLAARPARANAIQRLGIVAAAALLVITGDVHAADGDPDPTFSGDGIVEVAFAGGSIENARIAVDAAGNVFVGGTIGLAGPNNDMAIAKLRANGSLDTTFGFQGLRTLAFDLVPNGSDRLRGIFPQADGTVLLLGSAQVADQIVARAPPAIARLTAAGNADPGFGSNGRIVVGGNPWSNPGLHITQAARQRDGKLLFGGYCVSCPSTYRAVVVRLTAAGALDPTFGSVGWSSIPVPVPNPRFEAMQVDDLERIVMVGGFIDGSTRQPLIVRMTSTGAIDTSFGGGSGVATISNLADPLSAGWTARAVAIDRDQSMVLAVGNQSPLEVQRTGLVRLLANGTRDMSYAGTGLRDLTLENGSRILALALRSDRRVVAAGWIDHIGGGQDFLLARVLPNGNLDNSFDGNGLLRIPLAANNSDGAEAMTLSAGKPLLAGFSYSTQRNIGVLRMQSDLIFSNGAE